jgi:hypothetical protein
MKNPNKSRCKILVATFFALIGSSPISAADIKLVDGTVLRGEMISESDSSVTIRTPSLGDLTVPTASIAVGALSEPLPADSSPATPRARPRRDTDPSGHALFFLPTAFVPPRGTTTFRDFELFFLTFGHSLTNSTVMTAGFLFPVTSEFQILTAGFKQQLWVSNAAHGAVALTGNLTVPLEKGPGSEGFLVNSNLVASRRFSSGAFPDAFGFHGGFGYAGVAESREYYDYDTYEYRTRWEWNDNISWGGGLEARLTANSKFMAEILSAIPFDVHTDNIGLLTMGIRLHGERLSADIAGFRPLSEAGDSFLFWPLLNIGYRF